jgi:hypothetical protein
MMWRRHRTSGLLAAILACAAFAAFAAQKTDYLTEEESDLVRDAQGLQLRVPALLKLADHRLVALGLRELTAKEREQIKKDLANYEREVKEAAKVKDAEVRAKPVNPAIYLRNYSRTELLRGYMQVIDEAMSNIDDAYDRKQEVRPAVENLEAFVRTQLPLLRKFEPKSPGETSVIKATIEHSERALSDTREALELIPKTEKKNTLP